MRDLKFRAWDALNNKWIDIFKLSLEKDGSVIAIHSLDGEMYGIHQVRLMQYTGLKDRNGKEIYEGDIVEFKHEVGHKEFDVTREEVKYDNGHFSVDWAFTDNFCEEALIIGNIYESPNIT